MNLSGFTIFDSYGVDRVPLEGSYTADTLAGTFIETWIPYFECHKCGRWDYCKYAKPHPANPNRSIDIKCGVVIDCIRNFVRTSFEILEGLDKEKIQCYLDGAFYFYKFVYKAEGFIGLCMDSGFQEDYGEYSPLLYGQMKHLRDNINALTSLLKDISPFRTSQPILFVEGYAEKEFLNELKKSHCSWFLYLNSEVYEGSGNKALKRIKMLLDKYKEQGYQIYIQGDADGNNTDIFQKLIKAGLISRENTFVFTHDFESSIPLEVLYVAIKKMAFLDESMSREIFIKAIQGDDLSIVTRLNDRLGIDIKPRKIELARMVARILNHPRFSWWQDDKFLSSELGEFLQFIMKII